MADCRDCIYLRGYYLLTPHCYYDEWEEDDQGKLAYGECGFQRRKDLMYGECGYYESPYMNILVLAGIEEE